MSPVPAYADALPLLPHGRADPRGINHARNLVSGNPRILDPGPITFFYQRIAVAHAASLNLDAHLPRTGLRNLPLHKFKIAARLGYLNCLHLRHNSSFRSKSEFTTEARRH